MGFLVDSDCRFFRRSVNQAECLAVRAVEPEGEELDTVLVLESEIPFMGVLDVLLRDITQVSVNIHVDRHVATLQSSREYPGSNDHLKSQAIRAVHTGRIRA